MLENIPYNRSAAADYARNWALSRNPAYLDFEKLGGDCTNFVSQCLYAGCLVMNYTKDTGWYYNSPDDRAAAWSGVEYLHRFVISNRAAGVFGEPCYLSDLEVGDVIQLGTSSGSFYHNLIVSGFSGHIPLVCAHTFDALDKPLNHYFFGQLRCVHILGARKFS